MREERRGRERRATREPAGERRNPCRTMSQGVGSGDGDPRAWSAGPQAPGPKASPPFPPPSRRGPRFLERDEAEIRAQQRGRERDRP